MSPVHVLVSQRAEDEARYTGPFEGAIELYRFKSNVEAFERLTSAASPVDVLVVTPEQDAIFNMTPDQLVERLVSSTLGMGGVLANLRIVVVGGVRREHPRVASVPDLDAAVRLIKFGEVQQAPRPVQQPPALDLAPRAPSPAPSAAAAPRAPMSPAAGSGMVDSLISSIWDAPRPAAPRPQPRRAQQGRPAAQQHAMPVQGQPPARVQVPRGMQGVRAGGPQGQPQQAQPQPQQPQGPQLFAHTGPVPGRAQGSAQPAPAQPGQQLEPAQPFVLPGRGTYRGPGQHTALTYGAEGPLAIMQRQQDGTARQNLGMPTSQAPVVQAPQQPPADAPLPPGLADQLRHMVYRAGPTQDPLLGWSAEVQRTLAGAPAPAPGPVPGQLGPAPVAYPPQAMQHPHAAPQHPAMAPQYAMPPQQHAMAPAPQMYPMPMPGPAVAGYPVAPGQAPAPQSGSAFEAPAGLLARSDREADVSFG